MDRDARVVAGIVIENNAGPRSRLLRHPPTQHRYSRLTYQLHSLAWTTSRHGVLVISSCIDRFNVVVVVVVKFIHLSRTSLSLSSRHTTRSLRERRSIGLQSGRTKPSNSYWFVCRFQTGTAVLCVRERPSTTTRLSPSHMNIYIYKVDRMGRNREGKAAIQCCENK
jgi:hypothetical protein